jgi:hypothetical protein
MIVTIWEEVNGCKSNCVWNTCDIATCPVLPSPCYINIQPFGSKIYRITPPTTPMHSQNYVAGACLINADVNYKLPITDDWIALPNKGKIVRDMVVFIMKKIKPDQLNCNTLTGRRYVYQLTKITRPRSTSSLAPMPTAEHQYHSI